MFFYEGYICPVCQRKFQITDDIVACPECGAPHHRECWKQEGHCHFAADHGTSRQWKRPADQSAEANPMPNSEPSENPADGSPNNNDHGKFCSRCGQKNPEFAEFCSRCGQRLSSADWGSAGPNTNDHNNNAPHGYGPPFGGYGYGEYAPIHMPVIDPYGGVAHDEKIEDATAEEMATYVGMNTRYYLPRFYRMARTDSRSSWNWPAFLVTPYWLLYRKNYLIGSIILFLTITRTFLSSFIIYVVLGSYIDFTSDAAMIQSLENLVNSGQYTNYFTILVLMAFIDLLIRVIFGIIGNFVYMKTSLSRISKIRAKFDEAPLTGQDAPYKSAEYHRELSEYGGVSLALVAVAACIVWCSNILFQALYLYS